MSHELTNLLPRNRVRAWRSDYFLRLGTVAAVLLSLAVVAHGLFLLPSYFLVSEQAQSRQHELDALDTSLGASEEKQVSDKVSALSGEATYLTHLENAPAASTALRAVLAISRPGVTMNSISYAPPSSGQPGKMTLNGSASTRETLRAFQASLQSLSFVSNVDLPISAFAKDTDLPFTITVTGSFTP